MKAQLNSSCCTRKKAQKSYIKTNFSNITTCCVAILCAFHQKNQSWIKKS